MDGGFEALEGDANADSASPPATPRVACHPASRPGAAPALLRAPAVCAGSVRQRGAELPYHCPKPPSGGKRAGLVLTPLELIESLVQPGVRATSGAVRAICASTVFSLLGDPFHTPRHGATACIEGRRSQATQVWMQSTLDRLLLSQFRVRAVLHIHCCWVSLFLGAYYAFIARRLDPLFMPLCLNEYGAGQAHSENVHGWTLAPRLP